MQINLKNVNADPKRVKYNKVNVISNKKEYVVEKYQENQENRKILVAITVKNHAHSLPTFLATLETLECPTVNQKCDLK